MSFGDWSQCVAYGAVESDSRETRVSILYALELVFRHGTSTRAEYLWVSHVRCNF